MEIVREETYLIPEEMVCAIEYGDYSGLTDEEVDNLTRFIAENELSGACLDYSDGFYHHTNDVDDLGGTVVELKATWLA